MFRSTSKAAMLLMLVMVSANQNIPQTRALKNGSFITMLTSRNKRIYAPMGSSTRNFYCKGLGIEDSNYYNWEDPNGDWAMFQIVHYKDDSASAYGKRPADNLIRHGDRVQIIARHTDSNGHKYRDWDNDSTRYLTVFPDELYMASGSKSNVKSTGKWNWDYAPNGDNIGWMGSARSGDGLPGSDWSGDHWTWQTFEVCKTRVMNQECVDPIVRDNDNISLKPCISPNVFSGDIGGDRKQIGDAGTFRDALGVTEDGHFYFNPRIGDDQRLTVNVISNWTMTDAELISVDYVKPLKHDPDSVTATRKGANIISTNYTSENKSFNYVIKKTTTSTITTKFSATLSESLQVGVQSKIEGGIPFTDIKGSLTDSFQSTTTASFTKEGGMQWVDTDERSYTTNITIAPGKGVRDVVTVEQATFKIPMEARYRGVADAIRVGDLIVTGQSIRDDTEEFEPHHDDL